MRSVYFRISRADRAANGELRGEVELGDRYFPLQHDQGEPDSEVLIQLCLFLYAVLVPFVIDY